MNALAHKRDPLLVSTTQLYGPKQQYIPSPTNGNADQGGGLDGNDMLGIEEHFNGGIGTVGVAVQGYNKIGNAVKRAFAHKLSKMTGIKSGKIFQGAKGFAKSTGKLASKLGPVGTAVGIGVIG